MLILLFAAAFIRVVGSEFVQKYLGEGPRMVRDVFRLAKENAPAIIFIDEIDAIATKRFDAQTGGRLYDNSYIHLILILCMLYATFFRENIKHVFPVYIIPPCRHDTGIWNASSWKIRTSLLYIVSIIGADDLAMQGDRASATLILTKLNWINSVPTR